MKTLTIKASSDELQLAAAICEPEIPASPAGQPQAPAKPKGLILIVHGMAEHKERYYEFMEFLASNGYVSVVSDRDFSKAVDFLKACGYTRVRSKLYPTLRHEILHEEVPEVFTDILKFIA